MEQIATMLVVVVEEGGIVVEKEVDSIREGELQNKYKVKWKFLGLEWSDFFQVSLVITYIL